MKHEHGELLANRISQATYLFRLEVAIMEASELMPAFERFK